MFHTLAFWLCIAGTLAIGLLIGYAYGFYKGCNHFDNFIQYVDDVIEARLIGLFEE